MGEAAWINEIKKRIERVPVRSGRSSKSGKISFDDMTFIPAQLSKRPIDYFKEKINSGTVYGRKSKKPVNIGVPVVFGAMSFGALSKEAKIALAKGASMVPTLANTGEGGMLEEERDNTRFLTVQYSTGRFGITDDVLKQADAIEIKIGQGAKPGSGGLLPKDKITEEIAEIRQASREEDLHSPAYHKDIENSEDLKKKVDWLKDLTGGVPITLKLGAGDIEKDIELAVKAGPDVITVDGMEGGTGAAPEVMLDDVGLPTIPALIRARKALDKLGSDQELWIGGGFSKGGDIAKALALGADGVFIGFPLLFCMGCVYCKMCYKGNCPRGVATQDSDLRRNLNIEESSESIASFVINCNEEIKMIAGAVGKKDIFELNTNDLRALTKEMAEIAGIDFIA